MHKRKAAGQEKFLPGCLLIEGGMEMESAEQMNLGEQPEIAELLQTLEGNGLEKERQEVELLVSCLEGMESQFQQALEELKAVREQLAQIQDKGIKATTVRIVEKAEGKCRKSEAR